jgi:CBS domain-containing protein
VLISLDLELTPRMMVREAMTSPVITVDEKARIVEVARIMEENKIGAVIITRRDGQPVGIVTERDIVLRVVAKCCDPEEVRAGEVMSTPLRTVGPETSLLDAMVVMNRLNIRRLGVTYKGRLLGIISDRDILRMIPDIIEIVQERSRIMSSEAPSGPSLVGYCDRCGAYSTNLKAICGEFLCEDCRADLEE